MSTINDTDVFLINRGTASYKCQDPISYLIKLLIPTFYLSIVVALLTRLRFQMQTMTSLILIGPINRGSTSYKVSGLDFKTLLGQTFGYETDLEQSEVFL